MTIRALNLDNQRAVERTIDFSSEECRRSIGAPDKLSVVTDFWGVAPIELRHLLAYSVNLIIYWATMARHHAFWRYFALQHYTTTALLLVLYSPRADNGIFIGGVISF